MEPAAVTVLDQHGVALNRAGDEDGGSATASAKLELKKDAETYFTKKILEVLDKAFGPGQAIVSVDITFNQDQVKVTREDVIPFTRKDGEIAGSVTRKRQQFQGTGVSNVEGLSSSDAARRDYRPGTQTSTVEIEYENGKKVEQIVTAPGSIRRLSVGVILPGQVDAPRILRVSQLIAMTVGFNTERGDAIVVHSLDQLLTQDARLRARNPACPGAAAEQAAKEPQAELLPVPRWSVALAPLGAVLLVVLGSWLFVGLRRRASPRHDRRAEAGDAREIKAWLDRGPALPRSAPDGRTQNGCACCTGPDRRTEVDPRPPTAPRGGN
jgi:flagellar M-ring protein FliF